MRNDVTLGSRRQPVHDMTRVSSFIHVQALICLWTSWWAGRVPIYTVPRAAITFTACESVCVQNCMAHIASWHIQQM